MFASVKGGVGWSTALAVVAADLAERGLRVLALDLDLEAPGLGPMLVNDDSLPEFGVLDALVENGLSDLDDRFLADLTAPSLLAGRTGRIDIVPVIGRRSLNNPADVLAKIACRRLINAKRIRMAVRAGKIAELIDDKERRCRVTAQAVAQRRIAVERSQLAKQLTRRGKQHRVAVPDGRMRDVLGNGRLAQAGRP